MQADRFMESKFISKQFCWPNLEDEHRKHFVFRNLIIKLEAHGFKDIANWKIP